MLLNMSQLNIINPSKFPVCKGCSGFGLNLVQLSGFCSHCTRIGVTKKRTRVDDDDDNDKYSKHLQLQTSSSSSSSSASSASNDINIQRLLEEADKASTVSLDAAGVKRALLQLEKKISTNTLLRAKHADDPSKFLTSESDLDTEIKGLHVLAAAPELYDIFVKSGTLTSLLGLLTHENSDIVIDVINLLSELLSEDALAVGNTQRKEEEEEENIGEVAGKILIKALIEQGALASLVETCESLDSASKQIGDDDFLGVLATLELIQKIVETATSDSAAIAKSLFSQTSSANTSATSKPSRFASFLLRKITQSKSEYNDVKGIAAELLSTLIALDEPLKNDSKDEVNTLCNAFIIGSTLFEMDVKSSKVKVDGIEYLLEATSAFKKRNPTSKYEEEFVENVFDALSSALAFEISNKSKFKNAEGFELMIRTMHENGFARFAALRTISHALAGSSSEICETFIEAGGLKVVFPAFLGRSLSQTRKVHGIDAVEKEEEYSISIIVSCLDHLLDSSISRLRLLNKFNELGGTSGSSLEKIDRLIELHSFYYKKVERVSTAAVKLVKQEEKNAKDEEDEEALALSYISRLRGGLQILQKIDYLIAYLLTQKLDVTLSLKLRTKLYEQGGSLLQIAEILSELEDKIDIDYSDDSKKEKERITFLLLELDTMSG